MNVTAGSPSTSVLPGARQALILLILLNLFNYIDRFILAAVLPQIETALTPNDPSAKTKMGLLTTAFMISYMILAPVFGLLGDRANRWLLVGIGVAVWSLATGASGLAATYLILLLTRCLVGIGEAAYGPVAPGIISDLYPVERRGSVLAWFYMAIPVGSALGFVIGGSIGATWGWRAAFLVVVLPGLLLCAWSLRMPDPPRGLAANGVRKRSLSDYKILWRIKSYVLNTIGMTAMTFVLGGVATFMPTYVYQKEGRFALTKEAIVQFEKDANPPEKIVERLVKKSGGDEMGYFGFVDDIGGELSDDERGLYLDKLMTAAETENSLSLKSINSIFGAIVVFSGFPATLLGGIAGDRLRARYPGSYFLVSGAAMLLAFPFFLGVLAAPFPLAWVLMLGAVFCLFFNTGPTNTILANVSPPAIRASAFALNILIIHALGDAVSPLLIGIVADASSLGQAYFYTAMLIPVSGIAWLLGARHLAADTERAPTLLGVPDSRQPIRHG